MFVLFQLHLCKLKWCMFLDAHAISVPSDILAEHSSVYVSQNKPVQQSPVLQVTYANLAHSYRKGVSKCTLCLFPQVQEESSSLIGQTFFSVILMLLH